MADGEGSHKVPSFHAHSMSRYCHKRNHKFNFTFTTNISLISSCCYGHQDLPVTTHQQRLPLSTPHSRLYSGLPITLPAQPNNSLVNDFLSQIPPEAHNLSPQSSLHSKSSSGGHQQEQSINEDEEAMVLDILSKQVLDSLQPQDLADITRRMNETGLLPQEVKNNLDIMHSSVLHRSRCRYLMLHVCQSIKSISRENKRGRLNILCRILCNYVTLFHIGKQIHSIISSDGDRVGSAEVTTETILNSDSHLGPLYDMLSKYAYKWEHFGMAFHFSVSDIKTIESASTDNLVRLHLVIDTWLSRKSSSATLPTLDNLQKALQSNSVNLGKLLKEVSEILEAISCHKKENQNVDNQKAMESNREPWCQVSSDVVIDEPSKVTTILLEVEVLCSESCTPSYNWYKDEVPLNEPFPMLCIKVRDITVEGHYYCSFNIQEATYHSSLIKVHIETMLDKYKFLLIERYSSEPEVEPDSWPHVSQNSYISLSIVDSMGTVISNSYRETIRGDADDVFGSKSTIQYRDVLKKITFGNRVLIVGRPGSGKTTLVCKISQDWEKGESLNKIKSLFLISLRHFHSSPSVRLIDLIKCCFDSEEDAKVICNYIEKHHGLGACFILDGLDEYQPPSNQATYVHQLITGQALPRAVIIVASRPAAADRYRGNRINLTIEVLGFFKDQITDYIESYQFTDQSKCCSLQRYLGDHVNVHRMCYLPIQTAMICFLYDVSGDNLPDRESQIYYDFTVHTILRYLSRSNPDVEQMTLESLEGSNKDIFLQICKLAFEKTARSEQVIVEEENITESLGLITIDRKATRRGRVRTYSFCHLTFQEFLAAYHISRQTIEEQLAIIQYYGSKKHMYISGGGTGPADPASAGPILFISALPIFS